MMFCVFETKGLITGIWARKLHMIRAGFVAGHDE